MLYSAVWHLTNLSRVAFDKILRNLRTFRTNAKQKLLAKSIFLKTDLSNSIKIHTVERDTYRDMLKFGCLLICVKPNVLWKLHLSLKEVSTHVN